jgi:hypothetical protein
LKTYGQHVGAPEGAYKIVISLREEERVGDAPTSMYDAPPVTNSYDLIDPSFANPLTTSLTVKVEKGKKNYDPIELGEKIRLRVKKPGEF